MTPLINIFHQLVGRVTYKKEEQISAERHVCQKQPNTVCKVLSVHTEWLIANLIRKIGELAI